MPKYEVYIKHGKQRAEIEAESKEAAKKEFAEIVCDNLEAEDIEASNMDTEDGEDPV